MKRRITLSIVFALSIVLVSLTSSDQAARAQQRQKFAADTGVITLGVNQELRLTVVRSVTVVNPDHHILEFRRINYTENVCSGSVCKQTVASVSNSGAITLMPGEMVSTQIPNTTSVVRGVVLSNSRDVQVTSIVFDTSTQRVVSFTNISPETFGN